jgi:hypothetical protein
MSNLDWEKLKSNPVLYICFLGLIATIILWSKDEKQDRMMYQNLLQEKNQALQKVEKKEIEKDSIYKLLVEKQTIEKIIKDLNK